MSSVAEKQYRFLLYKEQFLDYSKELCEYILSVGIPDRKKMEALIEVYTGHCMDIEAADFTDGPMDEEELKGYREEEI